MNKKNSTKVEQSKQKTINIDGVDLIEREAVVLKELENLAIRPRKVKIVSSCLEILELLEVQIAKRIPVIDKLYEDSFGIQIDDCRITALSLPNSGLAELPPNFGQLQSLKYINLACNKLEKLPDSFINLKNLQGADLSFNRLKELPIDIGNLSSLKHLNLNDNNLKHLPESIGNLGLLEVLLVNNNALQDLPTNLNYLLGLKKIELKNNNLNKKVVNYYKGIAMKSAGEELKFLFDIAIACEEGLVKESRINLLKKWLSPYLYAALVAFIGILAFQVINNFGRHILENLFWIFFITAFILNFLMNI